MMSPRNGLSLFILSYTEFFSTSTCSPLGKNEEISSSEIKV